ncbi:MAG: NADH-quinone oxidoreductase subunit L [Chloroflexi bacterium]|nr:MAG: NADH-quinone oxidoreductase subunit L [Chloroflexota bacterium]
MLDFAWLIFVFPAAGALINLFFGARLNKSAIGWIASGAVIAAFAVAVGLLFGLLGLDHEHRAVTIHLWDWIDVGNFHAPAAMLVDSLSVTMALVVTGVGALIHIYATGYMHDEERFQRFFVYLNFFIFAMLILILSDNFLGMFVGWEGVGLASYLLIGFYFDKEDSTYGSYADAGKKAFIVNRIGDFGMMLAMMALWTSLGTLTFEGVFEHAGQLSAGVATAVCLLLLLAATGKSAQLPLFVWLPDAMAGPTPVSALIHAATMVTAGVYMIARTHVLFALAPGVMATTAWVGLLTALLGASIALVQTDLKKILAYSTISQLGYMILGVGVGAYAFAIFHLITHAFFKALLFLSAGNVMHGLHGELDIRKMGNLRAKLPTTYKLFAIGSLALAGFPLTSGFFSKDAILLTVFDSNLLLYALGLFTALLTAFYSFRAVFVTFWGKPRDKHVFDHAHESHGVMTSTLWVLAALALIGGLLNLPFVLTLEHWLEEAVGAATFHPSVGLEIGLLVVSALVSLAGIALAYGRYVQDAAWARRITAVFKPLESLAQHKWYIDELYMTAIVQPLRAGAAFLAGIIDQRAIDGSVNLLGTAHLAAGNLLRRVHNGLVPTYALSLFVGVVAVLLYFVFV